MFCFSNFCFVAISFSTVFTAAFAETSTFGDSKCDFVFNRLPSEHSTSAEHQLLRSLINGTLNLISTTLATERESRNKQAQAENDILAKVRPQELAVGVPFIKRMKYVHNQLSSERNLNPIVEVFDAVLIDQTVQ